MQLMRIRYVYAAKRYRLFQSLFTSVKLGSKYLNILKNGIKFENKRIPIKSLKRKEDFIEAKSSGKVV